MLAGGILRTGDAASGSGVAEVKDQRQRLTVYYRGHVQGVGFRHTARQLADGFDVCGGVRNLPDGRVELVAEGATTELEAFREAIRESGLGPLIRDESASWEAATGGFRGFQILR